MVKVIFGYAACALVILFLLYSWHEKDKEASALRTDLDVAHFTIKEKAEETKREQEATTERDEKFVKQDKLLSDIHKSLRQLQRDNVEIRSVLSTVVPGQSLQRLRSFSPADNKHEPKSTGAPPATSRDTPESR